MFNNVRRGFFFILVVVGGAGVDEKIKRREFYTKPYTLTKWRKISSNRTSLTFWPNKINGFNLQNHFKFDGRYLFK